MFDFFRKYNKFAMGFLFLLIIPSFVLFGVERYNQGSGSDASVASVAGVDITRPEWDAQHRIETDRIRQRAPDIEPALLDSDAARYATLERMVRDRVLAAAAVKSHLTVSEDRLARLFAEDPGIKSFSGPDGKFDRERFRLATGQTPEQYEASVRAQLSTQQVQAGITGTSFAPRAQMEATLNAFYDRREVQVVRFDPADLKAKINPTDAELDTYYKEHAARFQLPESIDIEYLVLDLESVKKSVTVSEAELKSYYEQNKERFGTKEERRASHILISAPADASAGDRAKAKAKAEQLLAELQKAPATFGDVARKNSQDTGSAEKGGDLDFVTRGSMVKPFEDAMFALKKGELSPVVETEFGYHIIRLDDVKAGAVPPFEQVRGALENEVRAQQATQEFAKAAEAFTEIVYQQPDSLQPAADKLKLQIQKASGIARMPPQGTSGALANRNLLAALYAPDALERKHNTEAIEIGSSQLASGRVVKHETARTLPFAEVKDKVRGELIEERAAALTKADGEAKLANWQGKASEGASTSFGAPVTVSRLEAQSQPVQVVEAALRADGGKLPMLLGVDLGAQGYAVVRVNKILPRTPPAAEASSQENAQFAQALALAENAAYYNMLKDRFKVQIQVPKPVAARG